MKVTLAAKAGFCFGVKRAVEIAEQTVERCPAVFSWGPLIHNQQVVAHLSKQGIAVLDTLEEAEAGQTLIIRSHGVGPEVYREAAAKGIYVADATCPFVQKAQSWAETSAQKGEQVVVVGDKLHPEVQGILGWAGEAALVVQTLEEAQELPSYAQMTILAQTTQRTETFQQIVGELKQHAEEVTVYNTICQATAERQQAAGELAREVDVMVVAGSRHSANTRQLADICAEFTPTYLIETAEELEVDWLRGAADAGLTAGASTPDWIIEEVYQKMFEINDSEMDMANLLEGFPELHLGSKVTGKIVKVTNDELFVHIGWKSEGIIPFVDDKGIRQVRTEDNLAVGDEVTAVVIRVENEEGYTVLSKRQADEEKAREWLEKLVESKEEIQAKVIEVVKGGLLVDVGLRGFVPASQIQLGYVEDLNQFLGQALRLRIIEYDPSKRKAVFSQKIILAEEQAQKRQELCEKLQTGDVVTGTVRRLANFGAFVDIGGIDGLLHISEMSYTRLKHPSEILSPGDEIQTQVLLFDKETGKLSLGLKQLQENPWDRVAADYPFGSIVEGKVVRIVPFGAFVQIADGVDGLIHISQLADYHVNKVEDVLKVGEVVQAKVIECKPEAKRISLSLRELRREAAPEQTVETEATEEKAAAENSAEAQETSSDTAGMKTADAAEEPEAAAADESEAETLQTEQPAAVEDLAGENDLKDENA